MSPESTSVVFHLLVHVATLQAEGLAACYIGCDQEDENVKKGVQWGDYQLVLFTSEMLLNKKQ